MFIHNMKYKNGGLLPARIAADNFEAVTLMFAFFCCLALSPYGDPETQMDMAREFLAHLIRKITRNIF